MLANVAWGDVGLKDRPFQNTWLQGQAAAHIQMCDTGAEGKSYSYT